MSEDKKMRGFYVPTRIILGVGSISKVGEEASRFGRRVLLVGGRRNFQKNLKEKVENLLYEDGLEVIIFEGVPPEPTIQIVEEGKKVAEKEKIDVIIGIGGGSVLDCAKAISGVMEKEAGVEEYLEGKPLPPPAKPFIAIPTTSGTGSEVTNNAVLKNARKKYKKSLRAHFLNPQVAIIDPSLTVTLPPEVTAYAGMDALTQLIESYVSLGANSVTNALTLYGIELSAQSLTKAVEAGEDVSAREDLSYASLLSGMALTNAGLGAVHGLAHPIGAYWNLPHGLVCAVLLPYVVRYNLFYAREKYAKISRIFTGKDDVSLLPEFLLQLNRRLGINQRLRNFGVEKGKFLWIAENSFSGSMLKNPRPATVEELVEEVLNEAW
ncbi:iron-containing alcohol dehydrogenase [Candidatus Calescamantes bacterium]|nr:iron-containing alcohol dehydrogenase [Candidatus Calescamantes bacterium]